MPRVRRFLLEASAVECSAIGTRAVEPAATDAMRFNGPAPETINGRLAMIGFVTGAMNEFQTATPLEAQVSPR